MRALAAVKVGPCHTDVSVAPPPRHPSPLSSSASRHAPPNPSWSDLDADRDADADADAYRDTQPRSHPDGSRAAADRLPGDPHG